MRIVVATTPVGVTTDLMTTFVGCMLWFFQFGIDDKSEWLEMLIVGQKLQLACFTHRGLVFFHVV